MVNIKLDAYHRVTSDQYQYILQKRSQKKNEDGEYNWTSLGFYRNLDQVLKSYVEMEVRNSNCETINEVLEFQKKLEKKIDKVLTK